MSLRIGSYGGGWQSNAALVLASRGEIDIKTFIFANVGEDSENPDTLEYIDRYARPFAEAHDLQIIEVQRQWADGREFESIYQKMMNCPDGVLREPIPVRGENGMPLSRSCTLDWKVAVVGKWCTDHGASREDKCVGALFYTLDEIGRVNPERALPHEILTYPLIGLPGEYDTGLRIRRADCPAIIRSAGLPLPPRSACWFCPNRRSEAWQREREEHPDRFQKSVELEDLLNARRRALGKRPVYLTKYGRPLNVAIPEGVQMLPLAADESALLCDAGGCFT